MGVSLWEQTFDHTVNTGSNMRAVDTYRTRSEWVHTSTTIKRIVVYEGLEYCVILNPNVTLHFGDMYQWIRAQEIDAEREGMQFKFKTKADRDGFLLRWQE